MALRDRILFFFLGSILLQAWCRCLFWAIPCFLFGLVQSRRGKNERRKKFNIILPGGWLSIPFCFHTQPSSQWILWQRPIRPSSALLAFVLSINGTFVFSVSLKQMTTLFISTGLLVQPISGVRTPNATCSNCYSNCYVLGYLPRDIRQCLTHNPSCTWREHLKLWILTPYPILILLCIAVF